MLLKIQIFVVYRVATFNTEASDIHYKNAWRFMVFPLTNPLIFHEILVNYINFLFDWTRNYIYMHI